MVARFLVAALLASAPVDSVALPQVRQSEAARAGSFVFDGWQGPPIRVYFQLPDKVAADTRIVFVMHGVKRDADRYLAEWAPLAKRHNFIAIVPEFDQASFPGSRGYNTGYFKGSDGQKRPRARWSFAAIEPLFDAIKARTGSRVARYALYGHSAGAQFVHRYVLFMPEARLEQAIAANAGWYTMPIADMPFPYGLEGAPTDEAGLKAALAQPLTILLGTADTDTGDPNLRRTPEANAQGPHRFARGQAFFASAQAAARALNTEFRWQLQLVPGIGHKNGAMAVAAAETLSRQENH